MTDDLSPGLYEELVSAALVGRLASIEDALVERIALRPADAASCPWSRLFGLIAIVADRCAS